MFLKLTGVVGFETHRSFSIDIVPHERSSSHRSLFETINEIVLELARQGMEGAARRVTYPFVHSFGPVLRYDNRERYSRLKDNECGFQEKVLWKSDMRQGLASGVGTTLPVRSGPSSSLTLCWGRSG
jgi:hypothetical protein